MYVVTSKTNEGVQHNRVIEGDDENAHLLAAGYARAVREQFRCEMTVRHFPAFSAKDRAFVIATFREPAPSPEVH